MHPPALPMEMMIRDILRNRIELHEFFNTLKHMFVHAGHELKI